VFAIKNLPIRSVEDQFELSEASLIEIQFMPSSSSVMNFSIGRGELKWTPVLGPAVKV
jgi:hypothetical protein